MHHPASTNSKIPIATNNHLTNQMINGGNNSTVFTFDPISRITAEVNPLCPSSTQFGYTYVDQIPSDKGTFRLSQVAYPNGQSSNFTYFSTTFDERLQEIQNLNNSSRLEKLLAAQNTILNAIIAVTLSEFIVLGHYQ